MDVTRILAKAIMTYPEDQAKKIAKELLDGVQILRDRGQIGDNDANGFRKSLNRTIAKEIKVIFHPDFTKAEKQYVDRNRRFFEVLEETRVVNYVRAIADPYRGIFPMGDDIAHFDLLQVEDPNLPEGRNFISIPVGVFGDLIADSLEGQIDLEYFESVKWIRDFLGKMGIDIAFDKKRATFGEWGFQTAIWDNHQFALFYFGSNPVNRSEIRFFILVDFQKGEYWKIRIFKEEEKLAENEEWELVVTLASMDYSSMEYQELLTKDEIIDAVLESLA